MTTPATMAAVAPAVIQSVAGPTSGLGVSDWSRWRVFDFVIVVLVFVMVVIHRVVLVPVVVPVGSATSGRRLGDRSSHQNCRILLSPRLTGSHFQVAVNEVPDGERSKSS